MSGCKKLDRGSEVKNTTVWVTVTVSFHFEKRTRWGYVWLICSSGSLAITTSCDRLRRCSSYSCNRKLATILCLAAAATSPPYLFLTHKALLVLLPMVMGLLSPRGSLILQQHLQVQVSDDLTWERCLLVLEFFFFFFVSIGIGSGSAAWDSRMDVVVLFMFSSVVGCLVYFVLCSCGVVRPVCIPIYVCKGTM